MQSEFFEAIKTHQAIFGLKLTDEKISALNLYYELVQENNEFLHLVAPCSAEEFAIRHILESLTLLEFLPQNTTFADIGTGAGLPSIPCLIVRDDLCGVLIESKAKKILFLSEVVEKLELFSRVTVINKQFEETFCFDSSIITCRALDKFTEKLPRILKWSVNKKLLFFGGNNLNVELKKYFAKIERKLMPLSEQRFLFILKNY